MDSAFSLSSVHYRWAAIGWTLAIVTACTIPPPAVPQVEPILGFDKAIHAGLFLVFASLWMRVICPPERRMSSPGIVRRGGLFVVMGILFSGGLEVYQQYLPFGRVADPYDAIANAVGLVGGISAYVGWVRTRSG